MACVVTAAFLSWSSRITAGRSSRYHLWVIVYLLALGYSGGTSIPFHFPSEELTTDQLAGRVRGRRGAP
jgi:hypothetical protein